MSRPHGNLQKGPLGLSEALEVEIGSHRGPRERVSKADCPSPPFAEPSHGAKEGGAGASGQGQGSVWDSPAFVSPQPATKQLSHMLSSGTMVLSGRQRALWNQLYGMGWRSSSKAMSWSNLLVLYSG